MRTSSRRLILREPLFGALAADGFSSLFNGLLTYLVAGSRAEPTRRTQSQ